MHANYCKANALSREVIGAAIEVHRHMGPGLLESIYEKCMVHELSLRQLSAIKQQQVSVRYKDVSFDEILRFDLLIEECLLLELKAVREIMPIHKAQLLSYMKLLNVPIGLLVNFHEARVVDGVSRLILSGG